MDSPRMTEHALRTWLRAWIVSATGLKEKEVSDDAPFQSFGLSSRDAVLLSGELEALLGQTLDPTIAYEYPTIATLTHRLIAGPATSATPVFISHDAQHHGASTASDNDIAIVGMAVRAPGATTLDDYWEMIVSGETHIGEPPIGRWSEYSGDAVTQRRMKELPTVGGYLEDIARFDAEFFGLSPIEVANMDPQQRIVLELTWEALEHARIPASSLRGTPVGVYMGSSNNDYGMIISADPAEAHPYALTGTASSIIANRISYFFDFRGPSVHIDTACSSSLVALHDAVRALRAGDATAAVVGGVNILASPFVTLAFGELGVLSPDGIKAFSDGAQGILRADAAGVVVLKRVKDALRDGNTIHAVIKGTAVNSDGRSNGLTAPNTAAQIDVLARAYADAGIHPTMVDYLEAHGTGTPLGDPIEATALGHVLGAGRTESDPLLLGSVKSNIGHSESAAGAVSTIKVALAMRERVIPPMANFSGPSPYIDFDKEHLDVPEDPREWPEYSGRMIAGVSGFGFGGTNAHVVLSSFVPADYPDVEELLAARVCAPQLPADAPAALTLGGLVPSRRRKAAEALGAWLRQQDAASLDLMDVARACARTNHARSCAVVLATNTDDALKGLDRVAEGKRAVNVMSADSPDPAGPVFVYSGYGSQHRKMGKELYESSEIFRTRIDELDALVRYESGWSLTNIITHDELTYDLESAQVAITAIQIALTDYLAYLGARPTAVMGMSMGEIAAAYAAGGLSAEDALRVACVRAKLMGEGEKALPEDQLGAMAVVELSVDELTERVAQHPDYAGIEPAVYAGPGMTTIGGPRAAVITITEKLEEEGKFAKMLPVKGSGHTSALDPILGELAGGIADIEPRPLTIPLFSSVDQGVTYPAGALVHTPEYFVRCTRHAVWFQDATEQALEHGHTMCVEIAPNPVAIMPMMGTALAMGKADVSLLYSLKRRISAGVSLVELLAKLYVAGQPIDFARAYGMPRGEVTSDALPTIPGVIWKKQPYWTAARPSSGIRSTLPGTRVDLPDGTVAFTSDAHLIPSSFSLLEAAAREVIPGARIVTWEETTPLLPSGTITTTARRSLGGVEVQVFNVMPTQDTASAPKTLLVAECFATLPTLLDGAFNGDADHDANVSFAHTEPADTAIHTTEAPDVEAIRWDPNSGETVEQRLRAIVSESMGYDVEDLPGELPLIDLGLDSLMGMRIKNRVENDFQIPPLQVQTLRDASVADVVRLVEQLVEDRLKGEDGEAGGVDMQQHTERAVENTAHRAHTEGVGVAPRDASERLVFAAWASITGQAAAGVTSELPAIDEDTAAKIAARLTERAGIDITMDEVRAARTLEPLSNHVREGLETEVEGTIRVLRERPEGSTAPAVFMFHPAGGSSVVYQPLMRRLNDDVPVYGVERVEGSLQERAAAYIDDIIQYAAGYPIILGGWSFGGVLAMEVAAQLRATEKNIPVLIALLDTVQPSEPIPNTLEETKAKWLRYSAFAKKTYGLDFPVPMDLLESVGEEGLLTMLGEFLATTDASEHGLAAGVLEHQRASFVDNRILDNVNFSEWINLDIPVVLYRAERMHDGAIELEPRYASIDEDGGWASIVDDLEIVHLKGDHLGVVDEPEIGKVGAHLQSRIDALLK